MTTNNDIIFTSDIIAHLVNHNAHDSSVVNSARVSTLAEHAAHSVHETMDASSSGLIKFLMKERHGSPFEHNSMTFFIKAPIFVFRELMRHRIASFNEESGRYRQLKPKFYVPPADRNLVQKGKPGAYEFVPGSEDQTVLVHDEYYKCCIIAYNSYKRMLNEGIAREVARGVLPLTIFSTGYLTINARSLMNLLSLRRNTDNSAYPSYPMREIEIVAEQLEDEWAKLMPVTHECFNQYGRVAP